MTMLAHKISLIARQSHTFLVRELQKWKIGSAENWVLMFLSKNSEVNQETIAKQLMIDKGAIAKTVSKLEKKGYIVRETNKDNHREKLIHLSEKGEKIIDHMKETLTKWNDTILKGVTPEQEKQLEDLMSIILQNASDYIINGDGLNE